MTVSLRAVSTAVPPTVLVQEEVRDVFAAQPGLNRLAQRIVATSFNVSGIETRYTVLDELSWNAHPEEPVFFDLDRNELLFPGTKARNEIYAAEATKLYVQAAQAAIDACPGIEASDITHVVTVSCTGFYAPGPDFMLVRELGLGAAVQRYHLGFMGCYAAMPALRTAKQFCEADAAAVVLVVSAELCTLHLRTSNDPDTIVASSLFADGAAAGIVTSRPLAEGERAFDLDRFETRITPNGEADMAWKIGDHGFEMVLSNAVPDDHRRPHHGRDRAAARSRPRARRGACHGCRERRDRALGHPSGRPQHPRQGGVAPAAHRGAARARPRDAARLRQHVERHGAVRAAQHPRVGCRCRRRPRRGHGLRSGPHGRVRADDGARLT